jgi:hypothetical protein
MFQAICRFFAKRWIPRDDDPVELQNALFAWKHGN